MTNRKLTRRRFLAGTAAGSVVLTEGRRTAPCSTGAPPALLGGSPVRTKPFAPWPLWTEPDERAILPVLRKGVWSRSAVVDEAERRFARLMGARYCLTTTNGTNALITAIRGLEIGAGDEVVTTPYTFAATIHPILLANALPVFADVDPETWQIDPARIEARITSATAAILPVHIVGGICDMDRIGAVARSHKLKVVEDACEAHLGEWKGRKVGTLGDLGCFSFQSAKVLTCGEGGAILGEDEKLMDRCFSFHNLGRPRGRYMSKEEGGHPILASKCRMAEYQASILITQMERVQAECSIRSENAAYLTSRLKDIPGIVPRRDHAGVTHTAFYYYGFRYKADKFNGLPRDRFIAALGAEGVPASKGLGVIEGRPMNKEGFLKDAFRSKAYQKIYGKDRLAAHEAENACPEADRLCEETVGFHHRMLLGTREDMDDIANAVVKVYENRDKLR